MIVNRKANRLKEHRQQIINRTAIDIIDGCETLPLDVVEVDFLRHGENFDLRTFTYESLARYFDVLPGATCSFTLAAMVWILVHLLGDLANKCGLERLF